MTKTQKITFLIICGIILVAIGFYYSQRYHNSYVLIFAKMSDKKIISNIKILNDKGYFFINAEELYLKIKRKETIKRKTVVLALENKPTNLLLSFIRDNNIPVIFLSVVPLKKRLPKNCKVAIKISSRNGIPIFPQNGYVSMNFDDGWLSVKRNALPILKKEGFAATVFIVPQKNADGMSRYLKMQDIRDLQSAGWEIGSHGAQHLNHSKLNDKNVIKSLVASKGFLVDYGMDVTGFAFPYGKFTQKNLDAAARFYRYRRISKEYYNVAGSSVINSYAWANGRQISWFKKKLDYAKRKKIGVVFLFHGVEKNKSNYFIDKSKLAQFMKMVKKSGLPVYSNAALFGKSLFLKQEYSKGLESEKRYRKRLMQYFTKAKKRHKGKSDIIYYPDGIITNQMVEVAGEAGFKIGFGKNFGYLTQPQNALNLRTVYISGNSLELLLDYKAKGIASLL